MGSKIRLDMLLLERGLVPSRERAQAYIIAGKVLVNDQKLEKPGIKIALDAEIRIKGEIHPYVSRGGQKLERALSVFDVNVINRMAMDIGASTGGFTDCLLQHGASYVFSIDVGYGQLDWKLLKNTKVRNLEKKNFRYLTLSDIGTFVDVIVIDVSFISLTKLLKNCFSFLVKGGDLIGLVKPQFEAGRERVAKGGVVKEQAVHDEIIASVSEYAQSTGFITKQVEVSPIMGKKSKNLEYLIHLVKPGFTGKNS